MRVGPKGFVAFAGMLLGCSVQTNVGRAPADESAGVARPAMAPSPASSPSITFRAPTSASDTLSPAAPEASAPPIADRTPARGLREEAIAPPVSVTAAPCASAGRHLSIPIPRASDLDASYRGAVRGIAVRRIIATGTGGWRNAARKGDILEIDVWARGAGISVGALGSESCKGGEAADVRFESIGHYRGPL
jgi:hypothetical protein